MKPGLRRIEATLKQLIDPPEAASGETVADHSSISFKVTSKSATHPPSQPSTASNPTIGGAALHLPLASEPIQSSVSLSEKCDRHSDVVVATYAVPQSPPKSAESVTASTTGTVGIPALQMPLHKLPNASTPEQPIMLPGDAVRPYTVQDNLVKSLGIPKFKLPHFSNSRHVTNPEFVVGLLHEMTSIVTQWQLELQQVALKIHDLYLEGPVIDGWLESQTADTPSVGGVATIRHAEIDRLMEYVEEICMGASATTPDTSRTGYRLCGLDSDGQLWTRPCPMEKVPQVSLAIARYQKLRQLLAQKTQLESRLDQFAKSLIDLHSTLPTN